MDPASPRVHAMNLEGSSSSSSMWGRMKQGEGGSSGARGAWSSCSHLPHQLAYRPGGRSSPALYPPVGAPVTPSPKGWNARTASTLTRATLHAPRRVVPCSPPAHSLVPLHMLPGEMYQHGRDEHRGLVQERGLGGADELHAQHLQPEGQAHP